MNDIDIFVSQAREKGLDDATIRKGLEAKGWDKAVIDLALAGLQAPESNKAITEHKTHGGTLSPLMAALHHVILWFFSVSSAVTIGGTIASLYGINVASSALASMVAVTLITFIPYALLFGIFLYKNRKEIVVPGKVWSIITICLHSIGAMIAAIVAVINLITSGQHIYLVSALLILALDVMIIICYSFAAFGSQRIAKLRKVMISLYIPLLVVMFGILFSLSLLKLGPVRYDESLRKDLSTLITAIAKDTKQKNELPSNIDTLTTNRSISYEKTSKTTYKVCATFQTANPDTSPYSYADLDREDAYVSEVQFYTDQSGKQCFDFTSSHLTQPKKNSVLTPSLPIAN